MGALLGVMKTLWWDLSRHLTDVKDKLCDILGEEFQAEGTVSVETWR